jgi:hypothetical protein
LRAARFRDDAVAHAGARVTKRRQVKLLEELEEDAHAEDDDLGAPRTDAGDLAPFGEAESGAAMRASTAQVAFSASSLTAPLRNTLSPNRVTSRSDARTRAGRPGTSSAASMRIELLPISMAA